LFGEILYNLSKRRVASVFRQKKQADEPPKDGGSHLAIMVYLPYSTQKKKMGKIKNVAASDMTLAATWCA